MTGEGNYNKQVLKRAPDPSGKQRINVVRQSLIHEENLNILSTFEPVREECRNSQTDGNIINEKTNKEKADNTETHTVT
jgi:hypothetical protein